MKIFSMPPLRKRSVVFKRLEVWGRIWGWRLAWRRSFCAWQEGLMVDLMTLGEVDPGGRRGWGILY